MKLNITIEIDDAEIARLLGRDEPRPKATKLRCGISYYNRAGEGPYVMCLTDEDGDFRSEDGSWYHANGRYLGGEPTGDPRDLLIPG